MEFISGPNVVVDNVVPNTVPITLSAKPMSTQVQNLDSSAGEPVTGAVSGTTQLKAFTGNGTTNGLPVDKDGNLKVHCVVGCPTPQVTSVNCKKDVCDVSYNGSYAYSFPNSYANRPTKEDLKMDTTDMVGVGFTAILFAVAIAIVVGTRLVWILNVDSGGYTYHPPQAKRTGRKS